MKLPAFLSFAGAVLTIALLQVFLSFGWGVSSLAVAQSIPAGLFVVVYFVRDRVVLTKGLSCAVSPQRSYFKSWLQVAFWQLVEYANGMFDRLYLGRFLPSTEFGLYGFSRRLNDMFFEVLGGAVATFSLPALAGRQNSILELRERYLSIATGAVLVLVGLLGLLFSVSARAISDVFGGSWASAVDLYRMFLLLGVLQSIGYVQASLIRGVGANRVWTIYVVAQAVSNILIVLSLASWGVMILASAIVAKSYLVWLYSARSAARIIGLSLQAYLLVLLRPLGPALAAAVLLWLFHRWAPDLDVVAYYAFSVPLYIAIWAFCSWVFCRIQMVKLFGRRSI